MKTQEISTPKTVNQLKHSITKFYSEDGTEYKAIISIRLSDDCHNGHNDFAITADIKEKRKNGQYYDYMGGCCHDEILKLCPEFKPFVDLHLCNVKGMPMYAVENSFYILKEHGIKRGADYMRISEAKAQLLNSALDKLYFKFLLDNLRIVEQWEAEANAAIKLLEEMTGDKFQDDSTKIEVLELTAEEAQTVKDRIKSGFYNTDQIQAREKKAQQEAIAKELADLKEDLDKEIQNHTDKYNVKTEVLKAGLSLDNFIYYNHTNEGVFNWKDYGKKVTAEQFDAFSSIVEYSKLPKGIIFRANPEK